MTERAIGDLTGPADTCPLCGDAEPKWTITRNGDVATSWACADDLDRVMDLLQRDHEVTQLVVRNRPKAIEWAELGAALR